jgi:hypothetical protein
MHIPYPFPTGFRFQEVRTSPHLELTKKYSKQERPKMVRRGAFLPFYIQSLLRLSNFVPSPSAATNQELAKQIELLCSQQV